MRRFIACVLVLLMPTLAFADPTLPQVQPVQGEISVGPAVSPMKKGQIAPFSGVLLSPEAVAKIIVDFNNQKAQTQIEVDKAIAIQKAKDQLIIDNVSADLQREKDVAIAQVKNRDDQLKILNDRIADAEKNKPNVVAVAGLGAVAGAALVVLSFIAVNAAK